MRKLTNNIHIPTPVHTFVLDEPKQKPNADYIRNINTSKIPETEDFTVYWEIDKNTKLNNRKSLTEQSHFKQTIIGQNSEIWLGSQPAQIAANSETINYRSQACTCYAGCYVSETYRRTQKHDSKSKLCFGGCLSDNEIKHKDGCDKECKFDLNSEYHDRDDPSSKFLNSFQQIYELVFSEIFDTTSQSCNASGLIVVAGSTGSGKSNIVRGIIHKFLYNENNIKQWHSRTPHLITYEDPIETYFYKKPPHINFPDEKVKIPRIDYTPRQKGIDAETLDEVLEDALRQKPAIVYIGETRDPQDWPKLLHFAGSGHLVITTMHADSVVGAINEIMQQSIANTPEGRSVLASRLHSVIHLATDSTATGLKYTIPAIWRRTSSSITNFMAEGLDSIVPNYEIALDKLTGSLGRRYFAKQLCIRAQKFATTLNRNTFPNIQREDIHKWKAWKKQLASNCSTIEQKVYEWDLIRR